jgi:hypothetical protein
MGLTKSYDHIIANASEAGRFSIKFKEEFDYKNLPADCGAFLILGRETPTKTLIKPAKSR